MFSRTDNGLSTEFAELVKNEKRGNDPKKGYLAQTSPITLSAWRQNVNNIMLNWYAEVYKNAYNDW